jgi:TolB-like protein
VARLFLSYSREDRSSAETLARVLEGAGHEVWWDRHIETGAQFSREIEQALTSADLVVVAWSAAAAESPWVRDEAAMARDSGRLLPVALDGSDPPLGFRQFQTLPLKGWKGGKKDPRTAALLSAIDRRIEAPKQGSRPAAQSTRGQLSAFRWPAAAVLLVLIVAAIGFLMFRSERAAAAPPTLAVLPFADMSPARDKGYLAEGVAEQILSALGKNPGIKVIGRTTSWALRDQAADPAAIRAHLGITHLLEGSVRSEGQQLRMSVRLIRTADGTEEWSQDYSGSTADVFALQDKVAASVADRLNSGTRQSGTVKNELTTADAYNLYLAAKEIARTRDEPHLMQAFAMAKRVVAAQPNFAPGHAFLAQTGFMLSDDSDSYGHIPTPRARAFAVAHARKAIELAPNLADGYAALGLALSNRGGIEPLKKAARLDPARSEIPLWTALELDNTDRFADAIEQLQHAAQIDPLFPAVVSRLVIDLAIAGRRDEAVAVVNRFEQQGGDPAQVARMRVMSAIYAADLSEVVRWGQRALQLNPHIPYITRYLIGAYHHLGIKRRQPVTPDTAQRARYALMTGGYDAAIAAAGPIQRETWNLPDFAYYAFALGAKRDWATLAALYQLRPGGEQDICKSQPDAIPAFIVALRQSGRAAEAAKLTNCIQDRLGRAQAAGPRKPFATIEAEILALQGRPADAVAALNRSIAEGWYEPSFKLRDFPAFDTIAADPGFAQAQQRLDTILATERRQAGG